MNQYNVISGKAYQGKNQLELQKAKKQNGFEADGWLTFLQARERGLRIVKGSKGISVFKGFGDFSSTRKDKDGNVVKVINDKRPLGFARVFNLDQTVRFDDVEATQEDSEPESTDMYPVADIPVM